ncbi:sugar phosphate isomerase/epimerase [Candidatus Gracilibacteria bacterium]|nr:sugar phosphate isomerase/epimerase [Candidatus Gracilibacteria bacterium]
MITLSTDSLRGYGLNRIFKFVKEAGYDGVDLLLEPNQYDTMNASYIKSLIDEYNVPVVALQTHQNAGAQDILKAVEIAKKIGTRIIVIQPPKMFNFKYSKWLTSEVPKIRQREEISIALENGTTETLLGLIPGQAMNNISEMRKFKHAALDTTRVAMKHDDLIRTFHLVKSFLVHVHLSNVKQGKPYCLPDEGILPLESFLTKLKQEGYKGAISFKIQPRIINAGNDEKMLTHMAECKKFYENFFVKAVTSNSSTAPSEM